MANTDNRPLKTPIVEVYNFNGSLIASMMEGYPIGIVSFRYKFDDEEDDRCFIKVQATDAKWIDYINVERNDRLYVDWGFINGKKAGRVMVVVRDIKSKYGPNVTWTEWECTDTATFLKLTKSQDTVKTTLLDYMKEYCLGKLKVVVKESGKVLYKQGINKKAASGLKLVAVSVIEGQGFIDPFQEEGSDTRLQETEYEAGTWFGSGPVKEFMEKEIDLVTVGRSPYVVIRERMRVCPNGPWYVTGRGNTILIHNRNLGNKPFKVYAYKQEPGDLIDFTPKTKYENFEKRTATQVGVDPLTKTTYFIDSYLERLESLRGIKEILEDPNISDSNKEEELKEWMYVYNNGYQKYKAGKLPVEITADGNIWPVKSWSDYENRGIPKEEVSDKTKVDYPSGLLKYTDGLFNPVKVIGRSFIYSAPVLSWDEVNANIANELRGMEMEKEEAKLIVEGDPELMVDIIVNVSNVQQTHLGNYYIKSCEHVISHEGYKNNMDSIKVIEQARLRTYQTSGKQEVGDDGLKFNAEERYKLEENVFRKWEVKVWIKTGHRYLSADPMMSNTVGDYEYDTGEFISLEEYTQSLGPDEDIEKKIIELYNNDSSRFRIESNIDPNVESR